MFFELSKIFGYLIVPSNAIFLVFVIGVVCAVAGRRRVSRNAFILGSLAFFICGVLPLGAFLLRPLENRFARQVELAAAPDGIIVLGGGIDEVISNGRNLDQLNEAGSRMTEALLVAKLYPQARFVFTGGSGRLLTNDATEAAAARRFFGRQGIAPDRVVLESKSRNTWENALFTRDLVQPKSQERWLIVTSAAHMSRAMGIFRNVGFNAIAWPADYKTVADPASVIWNAGAGSGLNLTDQAVREYVGLLVYYLTGKIDAIFPGP